MSGYRIAATIVVFCIGACLLAIGVGGILAPAFLIWLAGHFLTPGPLYFIAALRITFGLLLLVAAPASRTPRMLRIVAFLPLIAGVALPLVGVDRAAAMIEGWTQQGAALVRLTAVPLVVLGGFLVHACAPAR